MPSKVIITKRVEADLRAYVERFERGEETGGAVPAAMEILERLSASRAQPVGIAPQVFLDAVQKHCKILLPQHGGAQREYGFLAKKLRELDVTREQAEAVGQYIGAQTKWQPPTLDSLARNLPSWLTRAMASPQKTPTIPGREWDDE